MTSRGSLLLALSMLAAACTSASPSAGVAPRPGRSLPPPPRGPFVESACGLPGSELQRVWNGYHPTRSGDIQMVPVEPNTFGVLHAGPWDYLQEVPLLFYGPGHVTARGSVARPVTMPDVAPTIAAHLDFRLPKVDGRPIPEAGPAEGGRPPRLVLVVVWDGAGRNVLDEYPEAWPNLRRLIPEAVWLDQASLGSTPSSTPPIHATLGTGVYPRRHGLIDLAVRAGGRIHGTQDGGLRWFRTPTIGDHWDRSHGNRPLVGVVAYQQWHLGMGGHGALFRGGDRDVAVLVDEDRSRWASFPETAPFFTFPPYVNDVPGLAKDLRELDLEDGRADGEWLGEPVIDDPAQQWVTPAFARLQTRVLSEVIRREGFGADRVPDLLFTNYKQIDAVGHRWTMHSPQMEAVLRASDEALRDLVELLDMEVGRGRWLLVLTADHGVVPRHGVSGGFNIHRGKLLRDIDRKFDHDEDDRSVVRQFRPTQLWMDRRELAQHGYTVAHVAEFLNRYTKGQHAKDPSALDAAERDERIMVAFPSRVLRTLPCLRVRPR